MDQSELTELAHTLEARAVATKDPAAEARVLSELGRVFLQLNEPERAFLALARALYLAPTDGSLFHLWRERTDREQYLDILRELLVDARPEAGRLIEVELEALGDASGRGA
jgi:hypothetical protein